MHCPSLEESSSLVILGNSRERQQKEKCEDHQEPRLMQAVTVDRMQAGIEGWRAESLRQSGGTVCLLQESTDSSLEPGAMR